MRMSQLKFPSQRPHYPILEVCTLCKEDLKDPRTLPCLKSACLTCLEELVGESESNTLQCPECTTCIEIPTGGVSKLPVDPFVSQLAQQREELLSLDPKNVPCPCGIEAATKYCGNCEVFFGPNCLRVHGASKANARHGLVTIEDYFAGNRKVVHYCSIHPGMVIDVFCKTDGLPFCRNCIVPKHTHHDCVDLSEMGSFAEEMQDALMQLQAKEQEVREAINLIDKRIKELHLNASTAMNGIVQAMDTLQEQLDIQRNSLLSQVECIKVEKESSLKSQQESLKSTAEAEKSAGEFAQGLLESANLVEMARSRPAVLERMRGLFSTPVELTLHEDSAVMFKDDGKDEAHSALQGCGLVTNLQTSAQKSQLEVNGELGPFPELKEMDLKITAVLNNGRPLTKGGDRFTSVLTINDQTQDSPVIVDLENGTYSLKFIPAFKGRCLVRVKLDGYEIKGSPMEVVFNE